MECIIVVTATFDTARTNFNDTIVISEIISSYSIIKKVLSVPDFKIVNKTGTVGSRNYSGTY